MEQQSQAPVASSPSQGKRGWRWWLGWTMFLLGLSIGVIGVGLVITIVLAPVGLIVIFIGVGLAVPGALMAGVRRSEPIPLDGLPDEPKA